MKQLLKFLSYFLPFMNQSWGQKIWVLKADAAAVSGISETVLVPDIPIMNDLMEYGHMLIGKLRCKITTDASAGSIQVRVRWNGVAGVLIMSSANIALANSLTNYVLELDFEIRVTAEGATGTLLGFGTLQGSILTTNAPNFMTVNPTGVSAPAPSASLDLTGSKNLSITAQMDNTGNTNLIAMEGYLISLN